MTCCIHPACFRCPQLHTAAAGYAADGEVCCFQLITLAQEFLQQHNCPPEDEASEPAAPQSLWHEMLQVRSWRGWVELRG